MSSKVTELESIGAKTRTGPLMTGSMSFPHPFLAQQEESGINNRTVTTAPVTAAAIAPVTEDVLGAGLSFHMLPGSLTPTW